MNSFLFLAVVTFALLVILQYQDGAFAAEEKSCQSMMQELTKKQLGGIAACSKTIKFKNGKDKAKKMTCVMKCVLKKEALLDDKGQANYEQFDQFLAKHFPESLHERVNKTFRPCIDGAANGMDDTDEFCKDYDPLIKCLLGNMPNMCK